MAKWKWMKCAVEELNLAVLGFGQSFRWKKMESGGEIVWQGVMANRLWQLKRKEDEIGWKVLGRFSRCSAIDDDEKALRDYFQLDTVPSLKQLYAEWALIDSQFASVADRISGIRVLRQDPIECLFSFICSTNNNIKRITGMINTLCRLYGEEIKVEMESMKIDSEVSISIDQEIREDDVIDGKESGQTGQRSMDKKIDEEKMIKAEESGSDQIAQSSIAVTRKRKISAGRADHGISDSDGGDTGRRKKMAVSSDSQLIDRSIATQITAISSSSKFRFESISSTKEEVIFYDFPTVTRLAQENVESILRTNGFGYRAQYIAATAKILVSEFKDETAIVEKLTNFRLQNRQETVGFLLKLQGVGPKVADCVALMSMDKTDSVPIDTHVRRITGERYLPALKKTGSLTGKMYEEIGQFYRTLFGEYAGWAHSVFFSAEVAK